MLTSGFHRVASGVDVKPLLKAIERQPELWSEITARQETKGSPHVDTQAIFLRWCKTRTVEAVFTEIPAIDYPALARLPEVLPLIEKVLAETEATELGRVLLVSLKPSGRIERHTDEGAYADHFERFHVALTSDPGNTFWVHLGDGGIGVHMLPGEIWWFNHKIDHSAKNKSRSPRLHLIVDAVAPKFRRERAA